MEVLRSLEGVSPSGCDKIAKYFMQACRYRCCDTRLGVDLRPQSAPQPSVLLVAPPASQPAASQHVAVRGVAILGEHREYDVGAPRGGEDLEARLDPDDPRGGVPGGGEAQGQRHGWGQGRGVGAGAGARLRVGGEV